MNHVKALKKEHEKQGCCLTHGCVMGEAKCPYSMYHNRNCVKCQEEKAASRK